jgi:PAS domain S-box-containing protein
MSMNYEEHGNDSNTAEMTLVPTEINVEGSTRNILLEHASGFYQAIVSSSDDAIVSKTLDGIITSWNQAAERLFGYSAQEALGQPITLIIPEELHQEETAILSKLRRGEHIDHYETVRRRKDGSRIEVSLSISPVKDQAGTIIGAAKIARDITERKEFERRKDEFISIASHELKTPLATLQGLTQLLLKKMEPQDQPHIVPLLSSMQTQTHRLHRLINTLLDAAKIQSGHVDYEEHSVDLAALVRDTTEMLQLIYPTHLLCVQSPLHAWIIGDSDHLSQVVTNLVTNAVKYSSKATKVEITLCTSSTTVTLSVRDYGIGIPKAYQHHVFDRFFRVPRSSQSKTSSGLGLGLYITADIVKRHRGTITVSSQEQQGTTFIVSLPRDCQQESEL